MQLRGDHVPSHHNHLGSSAVVTDGAGNKVETLTYFPYGGTRTNVPGTPVNVPYKYTGQELDSSTGLYDYGARQYEPALGRFTSPDTIVPDARDPQSLNRYAYVRNNPLLYIDPSGHDWEGFWEGCWFGCDDTPQPSSPPPSPPPSVDQVVSQYSLPSVNEYVTQTGDMTHGYNTRDVGLNVLGGDFSLTQFSNSIFSSDSHSLRAGGGSSYLDYLQTALSGAEMVPAPVVSTPASAVNAIISGLRGDAFGAGASAFGMIPLAGITGKIGSRLDDFIDVVKGFLGQEFNVIKPGHGGSDLIMRSADDSRQVRFDLSNPHGLSPHVNIEQFTPRNLYPGDVRMERSLNIHVFPNEK